MKIRRKPPEFKIVYLGRKRPALIEAQEQKKEKQQPPIGQSVSRQPER
jgi:hypothetical protein